jgi:Low affinity iron permease
VFGQLVGKPSVSPIRAFEVLAVNLVGKIGHFAPLGKRIIAKVLAMREIFRKFAHESAQAVGSPWAFILAVFTIAIWAMTGPHFHYSDTWQLVINTGTSLRAVVFVKADWLPGPKSNIRPARLQPRSQVLCCGAGRSIRASISSVAGLRKYTVNTEGAHSWWKPRNLSATILFCQIVDYSCCC